MRVGSRDWRILSRGILIAGAIVTRGAIAAGGPDARSKPAHLFLTFEERPGVSCCVCIY